MRICHGFVVISCKSASFENGHWYQYFHNAKPPHSPTLQCLRTYYISHTSTVAFDPTGILMHTNEDDIAVDEAMPEEEETHPQASAGVGATERLRSWCRRGLDSTAILSSLLAPSRVPAGRVLRVRDRAGHEPRSRLLVRSSLSLSFVTFFALLRCLKALVLRGGMTL